MFAKRQFAFRKLNSLRLNPVKPSLRQRGKMWRLPMVEWLEGRSLLAISVTIDYSLDTNSFFDTQAKKDLLQSAADEFSVAFADQLSAIMPGPSGFGYDNTWTAIFHHPATGAETQIIDRTISANEVVIYAGGRDLGGSQESGYVAGRGGPGSLDATGTPEWLDAVVGRGQAGALASPATDFGPWGGSIAFTTNVNVVWHYGATTAGLAANETDFLSVATHELAHLFGFGISDSWHTYVDEGAGKFTGPASVTEYDGVGNVPLDGGFAHWADGTKDGGLETLMDPEITAGQRKALLPLDVAGLRDVGWNITDISMLAATTLDTSTLSLTYDIKGSDSPTFEIIVAWSPDDSYDGTDTTLFTLAITDAADRTAGSHTKILAIGSGIGQVPLPGRGSTENDNDYSLIVVADPTDSVAEADSDPLTSDNTVRFDGVYAGTSGVVYVFGTAQSDSIIVTADNIAINTVDFPFDDGTTSSIRFRAGPGNDTVLGGAMVNWIHGGAGDDTLQGNASADTFRGGDGNDNMDGKAGDDLYAFDTDSPLGSDSLVETTGLDKLDFSSTTTQAITLNLGLTSPQTVNTNLQLTLKAGGAFENLTGGDLADTLTGNGEANVLSGRGGNDTLAGGSNNDLYLFDCDLIQGNDIVIDSSGIDLLDFSSTTGIGIAVNLGLTTAQIVNAKLTLTLSSASAIENVLGSAQSDTITGNSLQNILRGNGGNDSLNGSSGNDTYQFDTDVALGTDTITDSAGTDTLDFSSSSKGISVDLSLTSAQLVNSNLTLTMPTGTTIENVVGSNADDIITGNTAANTFTGGAGDDILSGGGGNDTYSYNTDTNLGNDTISDVSGTDTLSFGATTSKSITLDLGSTTKQIVNTNLSVTLTSGAAIEKATGGAKDDTIVGNSLANTLDGGPGNDTLDGVGGNDSLLGSAGDDTLIGGTGNDTFSFDADTALGNDSLNDESGTETLTFAATNSQPIVLSLSSTSTQIVNSNLTLTLNSNTAFEDVIGGSKSDTLTGNSKANRITGGGGDDNLDGGIGDDSYLFDADNQLGNDTLSDSAGTDLLDFTGTANRTISMNLGLTSQQAVNANLSLNLSSATAFENITGGNLDDILTGNSAANVLNGAGGADTLDGGDGPDQLTGGAGNDLLIGGLDSDVYLFDADGALGSDTLNETSGGGLDWLDFSATAGQSIVFSLASTGVQVVNSKLTLTLNSSSQFENIIGGNKNDTLTGNDFANILVGLGGNDVLNGGGDRDLLFGGTGIDSLSGGDDDDLLIAGTTSHDTNRTGLAGILAEWDSNLIDYSTRLSHLRSGIGVPQLAVGVTVLSDGSSLDSLTGGTGRDWFFAALAEVNDESADEDIDII